MKSLNGKKCIASAALVAECGVVSVSGNGGLEITRTTNNNATKPVASYFLSKIKNVFWLLLSFIGIGASAKTTGKGKDPLRSESGTLCVVKYKGKEESLKDLKSKIENGEFKIGDSLKITVESHDGRVLSRNDVKQYIENLVCELDPYFFVFKDQSEYTRYATLDATNNVTLSIKYVGDFNKLAAKLQERYDKISTLGELKKFVSFYNTDFCFNFLCVGPDFAYQARRNIIRFLFNCEIINTLYTRNDFKLATSELCQIQDETEKISDKKLQKKCFKLLEAAELYKRLIATSILKEDGPLFKVSGEEAYKFNVSDDPQARALVKYILIAEEDRKGFSDDAYKFLLEKFLIYVLTSRRAIDKNKKNKSLDWEEKEGMEIFNFWLDLKNGKSTTEVALKLVKFLKKYLKEDELQTIKDKFLGGHISANFKEVFEENEVEEDLQEDNGNSCIIM